MTRPANNRGATLAAVLISILILLAAFISGCGGGGGGSQQGDKPVGDGTTVQKSAQATVHHADGTTTTIDFTKERK